MTTAQINSTAQTAENETTAQTARRLTLAEQQKRLAIKEAKNKAEAQKIADQKKKMADKEKSEYAKLKKIGRDFIIKTVEDELKLGNENFGGFFSIIANDEEYVNKKSTKEAIAYLNSIYGIQQPQPQQQGA
jgi:hypothetical protein